MKIRRRLDRIPTLLDDTASVLRCGRGRVGVTVAVFDAARARQESCSARPHSSHKSSDLCSVEIGPQRNGTDSQMGNRFGRGLETDYASVFLFSELAGVSSCGFEGEESEKRST